MKRLVIFATLAFLMAACKVLPTATITPQPRATNTLRVPDDVPTPPTCGNKVCDSPWENPFTCPDDCPKPTSASPLATVTPAPALPSREPPKPLPQGTPPLRLTEAPPAPATPAVGTGIVVSGKYLMAFHACDTATTDCHDPRNHRVYLAQSDDGAAWQIVPGWQPFAGSVPDVIRRGNTLYIFTPGNVARYRFDTRTLDAPRPVTINGPDGNVGFVDPSPTLDNQGHLVLFFLVSEPGKGDPAGCAPGETTCVKHFRSATEVAGSDGTQFALDAGDRASVTIGANIKSASDPDIFFDGKRYVLYIAYGPSISVWTSPDLRGTFAAGGMLSQDTGSVPAGHFDVSTGKYWTFSHVPRKDIAIIRRAVHSSLTLLSENDWVTVLTGANIGLSAMTTVESPGFAMNTP